MQIKSDRPIGIIENLRQLRHNINYYGYVPKLDEVKDVIDLTSPVKFK